MSYNSWKVETQSLAHDLSFVHIIPRWDPNKSAVCHANTSVFVLFYVSAQLSNF